MKVLDSTYLDNSPTKSLRYELCDIIYNDYKGTTFSLEDLLKQKKQVLNKIKIFIKNHPEILNYRGDSQYWHPYKNVSRKNTFIYNEFYNNTKNGITRVHKGNEKSYEHNDYFYDPLKIQFFLMCNDIKKMDCDEEIAKSIIKINNELFQNLFEIVGDTVSYNNLKTIKQIEKYIKESKDSEIKTQNDPKISQDLKDLIIRDLKRFNDFSYLLDETIIIFNKNQLEEKIPKISTKKEKTNKL